MKTLKLILASLFLVSLVLPAAAQEFQVPKNPVYKEAKDYKPYEKDVLACIEWLKKTPLDQQVEKRKQAYAFFIQWLEGAPDVSVVVNEKTASFVADSPDLLIMFMAGWTKLSIENPATKDDQLKGNVAGIKMVIAFYQSNLDKGLKKDKAVEKLIKLDEKGELEKWVEGQLKG